MVSCGFALGSALERGSIGYQRFGHSWLCRFHSLRICNENSLDLFDHNLQLENISLMHRTKASAEQFTNHFAAPKLII